MAVSAAYFSVWFKVITDPVTKVEYNIIKWDIFLNIKRTLPAKGRFKLGLRVYKHR